MKHDRDTPLKCLHVRTGSSRQTWSVSQNQIRTCEQDVQFCGLFSQTSVSCFSKAKPLLYNSKGASHLRSDGSFFALSALDLCSGSIGVVLALGWTTIDFIMNTLAIFVSGYRFRALFGSEIAAVSVDKLLLSGKKFCKNRISHFDYFCIMRYCLITSKAPKVILVKSE